MGLFRHHRAVTIKPDTQPNCVSKHIFRLCLAGLAILFGTTASGQQSLPTQTTVPQNPLASTAAIPPYLDKCKCGDAQRLKDRLEKLKGAGLLVIKQLQSTPQTKPASRAEWNALQSQINGYLRAMQIQGLTSFPDDSLFLGNNDPFCGPQTVDAGECLNQDFAVHQIGHDASCRAGNWAWQTPWLEKDMWLEEGNTIETEMNIISETIKRMGGCVTTQACPQFGIVVQNVTTSSFNVPGALTGGSARSLNNGQGVTIPLTFHQDGSFEGHGSGTDAGSARGVSPNETVGGTFGHAQDIAASGYIRAGNCGVQPCDVMHLVLSGGPNQQTTQMQARGVINRDLNGTNPTNAATLEFDLPAYVGGSAQKTFFSTPILNSYMTVNLVEGDNSRPGLPVGSSMLYAMRQCKFGAAAASGGGGGAAGVVIPGLEGNTLPPAGSPQKVGPAKPGTVGIVVPGLEGVTPASSTAVPASVNLQERVHLTDQPLVPLSLSIPETIHVSDGVTPSPGLIVDVKEAIHISDTTDSVHK